MTAGALIDQAVGAGITVRAALATGARRLAGSESARLDAELLLADALAVDRGALFAQPGRLLGADEAATFANHLSRRAEHEPVAYVVGRRGFRRLELAVDRRALVPRPVTELLVDVAIELLPTGGRVHDVGTGSGAVALALKDERPDLVVSASDSSPEAVAVARANASRLGLDVALSCSVGPPGGDFDLMLANLPYIRDDEWAGLPRDITDHEPREALLGGGRDGLDAIRALVEAVAPGMALALEHAPDQAEAVRALLHDGESRRGLGGELDVTLGRAP